MCPDLSVLYPPLLSHRHSSQEQFLREPLSFHGCGHLVSTNKVARFEEAKLLAPRSMSLPCSHAGLPCATISNVPTSGDTLYGCPRMRGLVLAKYSYLTRKGLLVTGMKRPRLSEYTLHGILSILKTYVTKNFTFSSKV